MRGKVSKQQIDELLMQVDLVQLIGARVNLKRDSGGRHKGLCCFHNEKTPSFTVFPPTGGRPSQYRCFGCGAHGDAVKFLMEMEHLSFPEAVTQLANSVGYNLQLVSDSQQKHETNRFQVLERAQQFFRQMLHHETHGEKARDYLGRRGLDDQTVQKFQIGYAPAGWETMRRALSPDEATLKIMLEVGLVGQSTKTGDYFDVFRDRLIFPIHNHVGQIVGFGGRALDDSPAKYINSKESAVFKKGQIMYGFSQARKAITDANQAILVEGYMDVVSLHQFGFPNTVAAMGTALTPEQVRALTHLSAEVVFLYDGDQAGQKAAAKACQNALSEGLPAQVVIMPSNQDPDDFLRTEGPEAMRTLIEQALGTFEYLASQVIEKYGLDTPTTLNKVTKIMTKVLAQVPSSTLQARYVHWLAQRLQVPDEALRSDVKRVRTKPASAPSADRALARQPDNKLVTPASAPSVMKEFWFAQAEQAVLGWLAFFLRDQDAYPDSAVYAKTQSDEARQCVAQLIQLLDEYPDYADDMLSRVARAWMTGGVPAAVTAAYAEYHESDHLRADQALASDPAPVALIQFLNELTSAYQRGLLRKSSLQVTQQIKQHETTEDFNTIRPQVEAFNNYEKEKYNIH